MARSPSRNVGSSPIVMLFIGLVIGGVLGFAIRPLMFPSATAQGGATPVGTVDPTPDTPL